MIVVKEREGKDVVERFLVKSCPLPRLKFPGQGPRENTATFSQNNAGNFLTNNAVGTLLTPSTGLRRKQSIIKKTMTPRKVALPTYTKRDRKKPSSRLAGDQGPNMES